MNLTDQQVAARAGQGEVSAFVQLVERYRAPLIGYLCGLGSAKDQAEELAQEAFCRVWEKLPTLRQRQRLVSWLYRIAHNLAVSAARRPRLAVLAVDPAARPAESTDPTAAVHRAVAQLPEPQRIVVSLRHFTGLAHEEIAQALGIPPGTVRSRLSRAYQRLRPILARWLDENRES